MITKQQAKSSRRGAAIKLAVTLGFFGFLATLHLSSAIGIPEAGFTLERSHLVGIAVLLVLLRRVIAVGYLAAITFSYADFQLASPALLVQLLGVPGIRGTLDFELSLAFLACGLGVLEQGVSWRSRSPTTFGSARLASTWEVLKHSDLSTRPPGVYLGSVRLGFWELPLYDASERHVLLAAPTGAGKTSGTIIPTLLTDNGSAIVFDPKGEIWEKTAGCRRRWQRTLRLDPTCPTDGLNPLDFIPRGRTATTQYALLLAEALVNPSGKEISPEKAFWNEQARDLLVAVILHVLEGDDEEPTLPVVADIVLRGDLLEVLAQSPALYARETAESFGKFAEETRGGIFANAAKAVNIFRIESIRTFTSRSSFKLQDLDEGLTLYLTLPLNQLKALKSLSRLLFTLLIQRLLEEERPRRLLFILDEFPVFERFDYLTEGLGYLRSYGVKVLLAVQGLNNLENFYGPNQTVEMNCRTQLIYPPADRRTAEYLSKILGKHTIETLSEGKTRGKRASSSSASEGEAARSLLNADEIRFDLPPNEGFLLIPGIRPVRVRLKPYFKNRRLLAASSIPAPEPPSIDRSLSTSTEILIRTRI